MFAGGTYLRGLWKQKPQAWGPPSAVQANLFNRLEQINIDYARVKVANACWNPGKPINYAPINVASYTGDYFKGNAINPGEQSITYDDRFFPGQPITVGVHINLTHPILRPENVDHKIFAVGSGLREYSLVQSASTVGRYSFGVHRRAAKLLYVTYPGNRSISTFTINSLSITSHECWINNEIVEELTFDNEFDYDYQYNYVTLGNSDLVQNDGYFFNQVIVADNYFLPDQINSLTDNPYQLWQSPTFRTYFIPSGTPTTDLYFSGLAYVVALSAGDVSKTAIIDGAAAGISTSDGEAVILKNIDGSSSAQAKIVGNTTVLKMLSGSAGATSTTSNFATVFKSITGAASAISSVSGEITLSGEISLSGGIGAIASASGQVSIQRYLSGIASAIANIDGQIEVTIEGDTLSLSGSVSSISEADGSIGVANNVAGTLSAVGTVDGSIHSSVSLKGDVNAIANVAGGISMLGLGSLGVVIDPTIEFITIKYTINSL